MIGYLKPIYKQMSKKMKTEYRSIYCGLCHTLKRSYGVKGVACLNYEIAIFIALILAVQEDEIKIFHGSCSMTPFLRVPFIDYLRDEFMKGASVSVLVGYYEIADNLEDEKNLKWTIAERLLRKCSKKAEGFLNEECKQMQFYIQEYYALEKTKESAFVSLIEASGKMVEEIVSPMLIYCKDEYREIILQIANNIGQWIYLIDACDDWLSDRKAERFNPLNLMKDNTSIRFVIQSLELSIVEYLSILPIKQYNDLINYMLKENLQKTSDKILSKYERERHIYGS